VSSCESDPLAYNDIDAGSYDPNGDNLTFYLSEAGPFGLGPHVITLFVEDGTGFNSSCTVLVVVEDKEELNATYIDCGTDGVIDECDVPTIFVPTYAAAATGYNKVNGCPVDICVDIIGCRGCDEHRGLEKNRDDYCEVFASTIDESHAAVVVEDAGGVGNYLLWKVTATDVGGTEVSKFCTVCVESDDDDGKGKAGKGGPTKAPSKNPTKSPTKAPTKAPSKAPSKAPTKAPTTEPQRRNSRFLRRGGDGCSGSGSCGNVESQVSVGKGGKGGHGVTVTVPVTVTVYTSGDSSSDSSDDGKGKGGCDCGGKGGKGNGNCDCGGNTGKGAGKGHGSSEFQCPAGWTAEDTFVCEECP
jgi:hypothetical protein